MKRKILLVLLILIAAIAAALGLSACKNTSYSTDGLIFTFAKNKYYVEGINPHSSNKNILIPAKHKGKQVISVNSYAFSNNENIKSVYIEEGVQYIGDSAFSNCPALTNVNIPDSVISMGYYAFGECESLTLHEYGNACYLGNINNPYIALVKAKDKLITECTINEKAKFILSGAFANCTNLTKITIGKNVSSIHNFSFQNCPKLIEIYNFSNLQIEVGMSDYGYVASYAQKIHTSAKEPSNLHTDEQGFITYSDETEGKYYFVAYIGDKTEIELPEYINGHDYELNSGAFINNTALKKITMSENTTGIGDMAFKDCTALINIVIPDSVIYIGEQAFSGCEALISATIGKNLTYPSSTAFAGCNRLVEIYNRSQLQFVTQEEIYGYIIHSALNIYTPTKGKSKLSAEGDKFIFYSDEEKDTYYLIGYLGDDAEVTLPEDINGHSYTIYDYAFYNCNGMKRLYLPDNLLSCKSQAFYGCDSPEYNESDGSYYIGNKNNPFLMLIKAKKDITEYTVHEKTKIIFPRAFEECASLKTLNVGKNLKNIGEWAFTECNALEEVNVTDIASWCAIRFDNAYSNPLSCSGKLYIDGKQVTQLVLPENITRINNYAFFGFTSLTDITIPDAVTYIGDGAFTDCSSVVSVILPKNLTYIGEEAFSQCYSLESITLPAAVNYIGVHAFNFCESVEKVIFENTEGWAIYSHPYNFSGAEIDSTDLSDPYSAKDLLLSRYSAYRWKRG